VQKVLQDAKSNVDEMGFVSEINLDERLICEKKSALA